MKRGIITASSGAITQLIQFLQDEQITDQSLIDRLSRLVDTNQNNLDLQISGEEAELFLDVLPPPASSDNNDLTQFRQTLQNFLNRES